MAVEKGCVGFCGTNARPSIAPTFGVAFPCLQVEDGLMGCVGVGFTVVGPCAQDCMVLRGWMVRRGVV